MYANSRMLYGLAQQGNAPKIFSKTNKSGVPIPAVLLSAALIFGCVLLNYFVPEDALGHLMYIVVGALVLNWAMISLTHLKFKQYFSVHDKFHRTLILSGFCLLKIAKISLNSSFFPKPIKR